MKEIPHCELSKEHYHLIRTDGSYRNFLMLEEMKLENEPSWNQEMELLEEVAPVTKGIAELSTIKQLEELKAFDRYLQKKVWEHTDMHKAKAKEKEETPSYQFDKIVEEENKDG